jgi:hypothetical protein
VAWTKPRQCVFSFAEIKFSFSKMKVDDVAFILHECERMFPRKFERLSAIYPPRMVMMKFVVEHTRQLVEIIRARFMLSDEYREACDYIEMLANDTFR